MSLQNSEIIILVDSTNESERRYHWTRVFGLGQSRTRRSSARRYDPQLHAYETWKTNVLERRQIRCFYTAKVDWLGLICYYYTSITAQFQRCKLARYGPVARRLWGLTPRHGLGCKDVAAKPSFGPGVVFVHVASGKSNFLTITDRVMQSSLVMQNVFSPPQNMLHCLFLLDLRYMLLLAYEVIFFTKKNDSWGRIENPQGV